MNNELLINLCICNSNKNLFLKNLSQFYVEAITNKNMLPLKM